MTTTSRGSVDSTDAPLLSSARLGILLAIAVPAGTAAAVGGFWPMWHSQPPLATINTLLFVALFTIGVLLLAEPGQTSAGIAMMTSAVLFIISWANEWSAGPLPLISKAVGVTWAVAGGWALYRYPHHHQMSPRERGVLWLIVGWSAVSPWFGIVLARPEWMRFPRDETWPTLWADRPAFHLVTRLVNAGTLILVALFVARWIVRLRTARAAERKLMTPTSVAAIIAGSSSSTLLVAAILQAPDSVLYGLYLVSVVGILSVPVAFLIAVLQRQLARSNLARLIPTLYVEKSPSGMERAIREALDDPSVVLAMWSADGEQYVDAQYLPLTGFLARDDRYVTVVTGPGGTQLAALSTDPALRRDPALVRAAAAAVGMTLQNAVLLDTIQTQYLELRAASARVVKSADAERRRLEQLLHDGAQQHFLALGLMIGATEAETSDRTTANALAEMRGQLEHALAELRMLAHGLHPSLLRMGLAAAIKETLNRYPIPITVDLPDDQLAEAIQTTAYYAICEAVSNSVKHSAASSIAVAGLVDDEMLVLTVSDDGCGGAAFGSGRGLDHLRDRVTALGGSLKLRSDFGAGTRVEVALPCE